MKNIKFICISMSLAFALSFMGGCKVKGKGSNSGSISESTSKIETVITLSESEKTINVGETFLLSCSFTPEQEGVVYAWTTSDKTVATIKKTKEDNGKTATVTPVKDGQADITLTLRTAALKPIGTAVCKVTVTDRTLKLDQTELVMSLSSSNTATINVLKCPKGETITWESSDITVCTVKDAVVTALKPGTAVITAKAGDLTATCNVIVYANLVTLPKMEIIKIGEEKALTTSGEPSATASWSSEDESIATVAQGKVKGVSLGMTKVILNNDDQKSECVVIITDNKDAAPVDLPAGQKADAVKDPGTWYYLLESATNSRVEKVPTIENGLLDINVTHVGEADEPKEDGTVSGKNHVYLRYQPDAVGGKNYKYKIYIYAEPNGYFQLNGQDTYINSGLNVVEGDFTSNTPNDATPFQFKFKSITKYLILPIFERDGGDTTPYLGLKKASASIDLASENKTVQLETVVENIENPTFTWESSNTNVATVSETGLVTGVSVGQCDITVKVNNLSAKCSVSVIDSSVTPIDESVEFKTGGTHAKVCADPGNWYLYLDGKSTVEPTPKIDKNGQFDFNVTKIDTANKKYAYARYQPSDATKNYKVTVDITVETAESNSIDVIPGVGDLTQVDLVDTKTTQVVIENYAVSSSKCFQIKVYSTGNYTFKVNFEALS